MAENIGALAKPRQKLSKVISRFHRDTLDQLHINLVTQQIWPTEVYPGYRQVNEYRRQHGGYYSTGAGARSFRGRILSADDPGNISLEYTYLQYMQFAEIGTGWGVKAEQVERGKNANYQTRYISNWKRSEGRSHRPAIRKEFDHLATRIEHYLLDFYGEQFKAHIVNGLTIDIDVSNVMKSLGL